MLWSGQVLAYLAWLPLYRVEEQGLAVETAIGGYLIPVVLVGIFNLVTGFLLQRGWRAQRLLFGAVCVQAAVWWLLPVTGGALGGLVSLAVKSEEHTSELQSLMCISYAVFCLNTKKKTELKRTKVTE